LRAKQHDRATAQKMLPGVRPEQLDEAAAFVRDWKSTPYPFEYVQSMYTKFRQSHDSSSDAACADDAPYSRWVAELDFWRNGPRDQR
jgi:hypothetical protein